MAKLYYEKDADLGAPQGTTRAAAGRGNGESWAAAKKDGLDVETIPEAVASAGVVMMLVPDEVQPEVYAKDGAPNLAKGAALDFAHGFNIRFGTIVPPTDAAV